MDQKPQRSLKRWYYPPSHRLNVNVMLSNITSLMIFCGFDPSPLTLDKLLFLVLIVRFYYRAMLCIRGTSHGPVSVRLSVCVCRSVTSRSSTKTAKLRITQIAPHDIPATRFLMPKISAKFDRGHPLRGRRMQVGWVKIGDFRQITGYISKTVKDRHIVSIKVE